MYRIHICSFNIDSVSLPGIDNPGYCTIRVVDRQQTKQDQMVTSYLFIYNYTLYT
jgi:GTP-binding protein EngB required for normal cell division